MNVKNRAIIRQLSFKTLGSSRKRNLIIIAAIVLTTLLFTSLFTIAFSINKSQQEHTFRQIGGYSHGTFKEVTSKQAAAIADHPKVKAAGLRQIIGFMSSGPFAKTPAEISFMDENCTTWSYSQPTVGHTPKNGKEITMDTASLALLGVKPELGTPIQLTWTIEDNLTGVHKEKTDTFTLVGWWEYNTICPVHFLNISQNYVKQLQSEYHLTFRSDLNIMMHIPFNIRHQMEQIDTDLGYTWDNRGDENNVGIGVNWGYSASRLAENIDIETILSIAAFAILVIFTGYLTIYNIFQISVTHDIRFYGLLKTIGVTPRQLRRIIRWQALILSSLGIPIGLLLGYGIGILLVPHVIKTTFIKDITSISLSPLIFLFAIFFSLITVFLSCYRPGRIASKVSPVEAVKYTESPTLKRKEKRSSGAKVWQMASANLSRNRIKTFLVVISLALPLIMLNLVTMFVNGFDMDKYLSKTTCADFIVSSPDYFHFHHAKEYISKPLLTEVKNHTESSLSGSGYSLVGDMPQIKIDKTIWQKHVKQENIPEPQPAQNAHHDTFVTVPTLIEGLDSPLLEKLRVIKGDLSPLKDPNKNAIALVVKTDDYGKIEDLSTYPAIGETIPITYVKKSYLIDSRTGNKSTKTTPEQYLQYHIAQGHDVTYTICAYVVVPYAMSYRYQMAKSYEFILSIDTLNRTGGQAVTPLFYLLDSPNAQSEAATERYLTQRTAEDPQLMYESKATSRESFRKFQSLFLLLGGLLCAIVGLVGVLNFLNTIITGILSRQREFAILQAVGMTGKQLKTMLIYEGLFYTMSAAILAFTLSLILNPFIGNVLETIFWFYTTKIILCPLLIAVTIFALLGCTIPFAAHALCAKYSIVEQIRKTE